MRRFRFDKLIRDKILSNMVNHGQEPEWKKLNDQEFVQELKNKILEEAQEIPLEDGDSLPEKIADIEEVISTLLKTIKINRGEINQIRKNKNKERGGFSKKIYVKTAGGPDNSKWLKYYLKFPQKYPEVK